MLNFLARGAARQKVLEVVESLKLPDGFELSDSKKRGVTVTEAVLFTETGSGTYTGTIALPANSLITDIGLHGIALWNSAGAVAAVVGDGAAANGFFTSTDLKATDLLAGETNNIEHPGGKAGAYIASEQRVLYSAAARNVIGVITVASGSGTLGRTLLYVTYSILSIATPVKS